MGRSLRRLMRRREKNANKKLSEKLGMFDKLGNACQECGKGFNKQNKNMVRTWRVVTSGGEVDLYCPACWRELDHGNE